MNELESPRDAFAQSEYRDHSVLPGAPKCFRLWIATYSDWRPTRWNDAPPVATAVELIEDSSFSEEEARLFLEGFNSQMLSDGKQLWAVAVPVVVHYAGDSKPGEQLRGYRFAENAPV